MPFISDEELNALPHKLNVLEKYDFGLQNIAGRIVLGRLVSCLPAFHKERKTQPRTRIIGRKCLICNLVI